MYRPRDRPLLEPIINEMPGHSGKPHYKPRNPHPAMAGHAAGVCVQGLEPIDDASADKRRLLLIIVGSSIAAEVCDRPLAYRLRESVAGRLATDATRQATSEVAGSNVSHSHVQPIVCTDLWYLNDRELDALPVIAVGDPSRNAATAMLCAKLPTALVIERSFRVHLDPEFVEERPRAALWGTDPAATEAAIDAFVERYLPAFLAAAG